MRTELSSMRLVPLERRSWRAPGPFHQVRTRGESVTCEPGKRSSLDTESANTLILAPTPSKTVKNKFLLFVSHLVYGTVSWQLPEQTKTLPVVSIFPCFSTA